MQAVLLAAGVGGRLGAAAGGVPKPMIEVGGRPILESNVRLLARHGFTQVFINLHRHPQAITSHLMDGSRFGVRISYSREAKLLGTAGAVRSFRDGLRSTFAVVYGDNLSTCNLQAMLSLHKARKALATVASIYRDDTRASGLIITDSSNSIVAIHEKAGLARGGWVSAGIVMADVRLLEYITDSLPADLASHTFPAMLAAGERMIAYRLQGRERLWWIDTPSDLERTRAEVTPTDLLD